MATFKRFLVLAILLLVYSGTQLLAQAGKSFWFVAPDITKDHGDKPVAFRVTAGSETAYVTFSRPAVGSGIADTTITVPAYTQVKLEWNLSVPSTSPRYFNNIENSPINSINNKGILITSTAEITAFYEVSKDNNPDKFTLKGQNALGTDFVIPSQNSYANHDYTGKIQPYEEINIVATEDATDVTITPSTAIQGGGSTGTGTANTPFTITLNKGQSYSIRAKNWNDPTINLGGTTITTTDGKKIAVTISDDSIRETTNAGPHDLIGDQIVPLNIIGKEYIANKTNPKTNSVNRVFIVAPYPGTTVTIDNLSPENLTQNIVKGYNFNSTNMYIKSNNPIYVYQVTGLPNGSGEDEMGSALLPPISGCTGSERVSFTRNWTGSYWVQIMVQKKYLGQFLMTSKNVKQNDMTDALNKTGSFPSRVDWTKVAASDPLNNDNEYVWYTTTIQMGKSSTDATVITPFDLATSTTDNYYSIENYKMDGGVKKPGIFHLSVLDENPSGTGGGGSTSYGYFSAYNAVAIEPFTQKCFGQDMILSATSKNGNYLWEAFSDSSIKVTGPTLTVKKSDRYYLTRDEFGCIAKDSVDVKFKLPSFTLTQPGQVCPNENVIIKATPTDPNVKYNYSWMVDGAPTSPTPNDQLTLTLTSGQTKNISVTANDGGCTNAITEAVIAKSSSPAEIVIKNSTICVGDTIKSKDPLENYVWTDPDGDTISGTQSYIIATKTGLYKLKGTSQGCVTTDSENITVNALPVVKIDGENLCFGEEKTYSAAAATTTIPIGHSITQQWDNSPTPNTAPTYTINSSTIPYGVVWLKVRDTVTGCSATDTANVTWNTEIKVELSYKSTSQPTSTPAGTVINTCAETPVTLTAAATTSSGVKSYSWSIDGVPQANPNDNINIQVAAGSSKTVTITITDNNNCTAKNLVTITAYATPVVSVSKATICLNESFTAAVVLPNIISTYNWYNNASALIHTGASYTPTSVGTYTLSGISSNGCISNTIPLTVNGLPSAAMSGQIACPNTNFVFDGSGSTGATSYLWSQPGVPFDGTKSYTSSTFIVKKPGTVWLEVTNAASCKATISGNPSWKPLHTVDISYTTASGTSSADTASVCPGTPITLTGNVLPADGAVLTYSWKIGGVQVGTNSTYTLSPAANSLTKVTLDVTYDNCPATKSVFVKGFSDINAELTAQEVCLNSTLELSESVNPSKIADFKWSFVATGTNITADVFDNITPTVGGDYKLEVVDLNGCSGSIINKVNDPSFTISGALQVPLCDTETHTFTIVSPKADYTYTWETPSGSIITTTSYTAADSGYYKITSRYKKPLECFDSLSVQVLKSSNRIIDVDTKLSVCNSQTPIATITSHSTQYSNYSWKADGAIVAGNTPTYTVPNIAPHNSVGIHKYEITATYTFPISGKTCPVLQKFDLDIKNVSVLLDYDLSKRCDLTDLLSPICLCDGESIEFNTSSSIGYSSLLWTITDKATGLVTTQTGPKVVAAESGTYHLDAMQANGCPTEGTVEVVVTPIPELTLTSTKECTGTPIEIQNSKDTPLKIYNYKWIYNNVDLLNNNYNYKTTITGKYKVIAIATSNARCTKTSHITIKYPTKPSVALKDNAICSSTPFNLIPEFTGISPQTTPASIIINTPTWTYGTTHNLVPDPTKVNTTGTYNLDLLVTTDLGNDCPYSYPLNLNVVQEPQFNIAPQTICEGLNTTLNATVSSGSYNSLLWKYTENVPNGPTIPPAKPYSPTQDFPGTSSITVEQAGYYNVSGTTSGIRPPIPPSITTTTFTCTSTSSPILLTVNPKPDITVAPIVVPPSFYICKNSFVDIEATSSTVLSKDYSWSNGVNGINQITVDKGGYYEAIGTDSNNCKDTSGVEMISYVKTPVILPVIQPFCANNPQTLPLIPGVAAFQWYFDFVGNTETGGLGNTMVADKTGIYWLSYKKESNGCWVDTSLYVNVLPMPIISGTPNKQICNGESYLLDPKTTGKYSYQWSRVPIGGGASQIVSNDKTYVAKSSGNYTLVATENGCATTTSTEVIVNPIPTVILGPDFNYCKDVPFTISVKNPAGLSGYIWNTGAADNGKTSITASKDGIYTVTAFNTFNCSNDTSIIATSYPVQSLAKLPAIETVCDNSTFTLTSPLIVPTEIQSYQWFYNSLTSGVQGNINTPWTRNGTQSGTYIYQVRDLNGCYTSKSMPLALLSSPVVDLPTVGCLYDTLNVVPQDSHLSYMWNRNPSFNKHYIIVNVPGSSLYEVEVIDKNGCSTFASTNFNARPLPQISLGNDIEICAGLEATLTPVGDPYTSIVWSTSPYDTINSIKVGPGIYTATVKDANKCANTSASVRVDWLPLPNIFLGNDTTICPMSTLVLDAGRDSVGIAYPSYLWEPNNATTQTNQANIYYNYVQATDNKGCTGWTTILVHNLVPLEYKIPSDTLCDNITHTLDGTDGGLYPNVRWRYATTDTLTPTLDVSAPGGTYIVDANDGCFTVADTVTIGFWETPTITSIDTMIYARLTIHVDSGLQPYMYTLNQGNLQPSNVFYLGGNGTYEVYVQDQNGCWAKDTVEINSVLDIDIPKFFTPNEDGYNDKWKIEGLQERFPDAMLSIYDRYGRFLVKFRGDAEGWDGTYLGQPMQSDDYWFYLDLVQINKTIKGNLTLKR